MNFLTKETLRKVPQLTIFFWIIKLLSTALGESTSDYLVFHVNPYFAVALGAIGLTISLFLQLFVKRYVAWIYWLTVVMVAIFGTMAADVLHVGFGIPYLISSIFFSVSLAVIFALWYLVEKTLSIHSIHTLRRELFYWATVMTTFALGTALGDLTAATFGLGYLLSGILFAAIFIIPALGFKFAKWNAIFSFWFAYIITRPFGASFADYFGKSTLGGIGIGDEITSAVLAVLIIIFVIYLSVSRKDTKLTT
jgi:uncharacterized membrane-anchored protein